MLQNRYRFIGAGLLLLLTAACQNVKGGASAGGSTGAEAVDANLEPTLRKAAADSETSYNYAEAAQHYSMLLERHPNDQDLVLAVARNLRYSGSPQQAVQVVNSRIKKVGAKEPLLIELGKDYLAADQLNLAVSVLQQARDLDAGNWQAYSALGVAQETTRTLRQPIFRASSLPPITRPS
jgi:Flp pilus assembly protein TadD